MRAVAPVLSRMDIREVSDYGNTNGEVSGVPPKYNTIRYLPLAAGRWLNQDDEAQVRMVAVIGDEMLKNLFPGRPAVGSTILLNGSASMSSAWCSVSAMATTIRPTIAFSFLSPPCGNSSR